MMSADEHTLEHPSEHLLQNLATAVEGALWDFDPLRQTNSHLGVATEGASVTLHGNVRTEIMKAVAGQLASKVVGVRSVVNRLITDTQLEHEAAMKLALDPEVGLLTDKINVNSLLGTLYLSGTATGTTQAEAEAARSKAATLVAGLAGVHEVVNDLKAAVGGADASAAGEGAEGAAMAGGDASHQAAIQARLAVWRERAAAKQG